MIADRTDALDRLEEEIKKLKMAYEKYFAGVERVAPLKAREQVRKTLRHVTGVGINNTARRFRVQSLQATLITYESYWDRVTRQIEEGTYRRDIFRLQRRSAELARSEASSTPVEPAQPEASSAPAKAPLPAREAAPHVQTSRGHGLPGKERAPPDSTYPESLRKLHAAYQKARRDTGDNRPVAIAALAATVKKQVATIKERYKCSRVEFKVVIKDGKAILKAIPKQ